MRTISFNMFPQDEIDDFLAACKKYGVKASQFLIKAEEYSQQSPGIEPIQRDVLVYHPSGDARRYKGGHGSHWTVDFANDLAAGVYMRP